MIKSTLVLEGGANRGVFTAGVVDYFMDRDLNFSHVIGVSSGACNAVDYVSEQRGRTKDCMIINDENNRYIKFDNLVRGKPFIDLEKVIVEFGNKQFPFNFEKYSKSEKKCFLVTTNAETGEAEYLDDRDNKDRLFQIVKASCTLPFICPETKVDDKPYFDGGVADSIPIDFAKSLENEKIIVILTQAASYLKENPSIVERELMMTMYQQKYPKMCSTYLERWKNYNETLNKIDALEKAGEIFVIRPTRSIVDRAEQDMTKLEATYQHGYEIGRALYSELCKYLEIEETLDLRSNIQVVKQLYNQLYVNKSLEKIKAYLDCEIIDVNITYFELLNIYEIDNQVFAEIKGIANGKIIYEIQKFYLENLVIKDYQRYQLI